MGLNQKATDLIQSYEQQARETLPHFDREMKKADGRGFYVVTKIYNEKIFEQVYVKVEAKEGDNYVGKIASEPTGLVKFKLNAPMSVAPKDTADWVIVSKDGEEEGNLTGKAMDALHAGVLTFVFSMQPKQGVFSVFKVVSVRNPKTQQEVGGIVPDKIVAKVEAEAKKRFGKLKAEDEKEKFQFILVSFPTWEFVKE